MDSFSRLFVTRIRIHKFCIDFKEAAVAVKTKQEVVQQDNGYGISFLSFSLVQEDFIYITILQIVNLTRARKLISSENTRILTTNLPLLEKLC